MPTLESFDAEFGIERACDLSARARVFLLVGLVLTAVVISDALLWGSVDQQVWRLIASRAVEGWQQFQKTDDQDVKQQVDGLLGEIETLKTSMNELASPEQPMLDSISLLEGARPNFQQGNSIGLSHNWYDDWNSLFYRNAAEPAGRRAATPQTLGAARPVVQTPALPRNYVSAPLSLVSP